MNEMNEAGNDDREEDPMSTPIWHADATLLDRYTDGGTELALAASIEAHLMRCEQCRATLAARTRQAEPELLDRAWDGIREQIQRPPLPPVLRLLRRAGLSEEDSILLSASRSLRGPWTMATAVIMVFAVAASFPGETLSKAAYLLVAPLIPVLGVAMAFGSSELTTEITDPTPYSKARLTLLRTAAVTITTVPLIVAAGIFMPFLDWIVIAWLGPAIGLTIAALVALTWFGAEVTATAIAISWAVVVGTAYGQHDITAIVRTEAQLVYLVLAVVTAALLVVRIRSARTPGGYA